MTRLLVLRPEPGASETVERARERGFDAVAVPLFQVEPVAWQAPEVGGFDGLLLTSANAVRHAGDKLPTLRGLPVYAVGDATAEAARNEGFDVAATGNAGIDRLLGSIESDLRLLHLCGEDRRAPKDARQRLTSIPVYRATPVDAPDLGSVAGTVALIHSPRAGARFAELVRDGSSISLVAISEAAAKACAGGWAAIETAGEPTDEALLALAARLCNNPPLE
jgi:uroporphyrinogen-III synthase